MVPVRPAVIQQKSRVLLPRGYPDRCHDTERMEYDRGEEDVHRGGA